MTTSKSFNVSKYFSENSPIDNIVTGIQPVGIQTYNTVNDLPLSGVTPGSQAYVNENNRLYMWTGAGWFSIALINQNPAFDSGGGPAASYELDSAGAGIPLIIQLSASDPEDLPIQWSYVASDSAQYFADITNDSSVFTIIAKPTSIIEQYDAAGGGTFSITFKASDGVNLATALSEFTVGLMVAPVVLSDYSLNTSYPNTYGGSYTVKFNSNGTRFWNLSSQPGSGTTLPAIYQYELATPFDPASYTSVATYIPTWSNTYPASALDFSSNGYFMFIFSYNTSFVYKIPLSTPFDVSTAGAVVQSLSFLYNTGSNLGGGGFSPDGTKLITTHRQKLIHIRTLGTPYDLSTASSPTIIDVSAYMPTGSCHGFRFTSVGSNHYFLIGTRLNLVYAFNLTTQGDVTTIQSVESRNFGFTAYDVEITSSKSNKIIFLGQGSGDAGVFHKFTR